jgi:hypothetical protein
MPPRKKGTASVDDENSVAAALAAALKATEDSASVSSQLVSLLSHILKLPTAATEDLAKRSGQELAKWVRQGLMRAGDKRCGRGDEFMWVLCY